MIMGYWRQNCFTWVNCPLTSKSESISDLNGYGRKKSHSFQKYNTVSVNVLAWCVQANITVTSCCTHDCSHAETHRMTSMPKSKIEVLLAMLYVLRAQELKSQYHEADQKTISLKNKELLCSLIHFLDFHPCDFMFSVWSLYPWGCSTEIF